jgi:serine/threonine-protein kinase
MDLVEGSTLRDMLRVAGRLDVDVAMRLVQEIVAALEHAHDRSVVHGDLKPENVLLTANGETRLTDFGGVSGAGSPGGPRSLASGSLASTDTGTLSATTLAYAAPEVLSGTPPDETTDVYSVGVILFELLTGERPGVGDSLSGVTPPPPPGLEGVFTRACSRRGDRFRSASEFRVALEEVLCPLAPTTRRDGDSIPSHLLELAADAQASGDAIERDAEAAFRETLRLINDPPGP